MEQIKSDLYEKHMNYIKNEDIGGVEYTINKNQIRVVSEESNTLFVSMKRRNYIELNDLIELMKEVKKLAREQKVKLKGINLLKEKMPKLHEEYQEVYKKYDEDFDILAVLWHDHVDKLKLGTIDDVIYREVIQKRQFDLEKYGYQSSILSRIENVRSRLYETKEELKRKNSLTMVQF